MQIQIKLFATFRQHLPPEAEGGVCEVTVPAGRTAGEVLLRLGVPAGMVVMMIDGRHCPADQILQEGDVLSAFPAIAGGHMVE
jgi:sulfur carrier protein ThiS